MTKEISQEAQNELFKVNLEFIMDALKEIKDSLARMQGAFVSREEIDKKVAMVHMRVDKHEKQMTDELSRYVQKTEYDPIRAIVYGLAGLILMAFMGGLVAIVFGQK